MLESFGRGPRHGSGDGVAVLAWQVSQQPREVALHACPTGRAAEEGRKGGQVSGEFRQYVGTGFRDNGCLHTGYYDFHVSIGEYGCNVYKHNYTAKLTK
jgi:hypothetical protein